MTYIRVLAITEAKKEYIERLSNTRYKVVVREPPVRNMANKRITELLKAFFVAKEVRLISGHREPKKLFDIDSQELENVQKRTWRR